MPKKPIVFSLVLIPVLAIFGLYYFYLYPQDISWNGFFAGILPSLTGQEDNKLIRINLHNHAIALYEDDVLIKQTRIAGIGDLKASPTPQGNFKVLSKEKRHVNWTMKVVMPLSLRFYKGYYLHDIPETLSGKLITTKYSHGCIRLNHDLAQELFNWANIGTKIQIYDSQLVKTADSPDIYYLTENGSKELIPSPEVFQNRSFKWPDVITIPSAELNAYQEARTQ